MIHIYFYFLFPLILGLYLNHSNIAILKFKTYYPYLTENSLNINNFNHIDYINSIHLSQIYLQIETGNESNYTNNKSQILNVIIDMNQDYFISTDTYFKNPTFHNNILCNYNISLSSTFEDKEMPKLILSQKPFSCQGEDSFKIYTNISLNEYNYIRMGFIIDFCHKNTKLCGNIGLYRSFRNIKNYYFLPQIFNLSNISEHFWTLKYAKNSSEEGIIVFGGIPFENSQMYDKKEENIIKIYSKNRNWEILMDELIFEGYNNSDIPRKEEFIDIIISPEIEGLEFSDIYFDKLFNNFFREYIIDNICSSFKVNKTYIIIKCKGEKFGINNIKQFPKITFYKFKDKFNFSFEGEDLFYFKNNVYYCKIIKNLARLKKFTLGRLLLRKYLLSFNYEKNEIYFYKDIQKNDILNKNINNKLIAITCIIFITLLAILLVFSGFLLGKMLYKVRKKLVYELNENYLYVNDTKSSSNIFLELSFQK